MSNFLFPRNWERTDDVAKPLLKSRLHSHQALGDRFDFLAYYSDFRIDSQEASTPSDGPVGGNVTGIGVENSRCRLRIVRRWPAPRILRCLKFLSSSPRMAICYR